PSLPLLSFPSLLSVLSSPLRGPSSPHGGGEQGSGPGRELGEAAHHGAAVCLRPGQRARRAHVPPDQSAAAWPPGARHLPRYLPLLPQLSLCLSLSLSLSLCLSE